MVNLTKRPGDEAVSSDRYDFIAVLWISFRFHACNNEVRGFS